MTERNVLRRGALVVPVAAAIVGPLLAVLALAGPLATAPAGRYVVAGVGLALLVVALGALAVERELHLRHALRLVEDERVRADALAHEAAHDALTGVLNRSAFLTRLELAVARARLHQRTLAVLFLDLDGFKQVNDVLGHDVGDRLLVRVADRMRACLRGADAVARFGGDEFAVLLEDVADADAAFEVADRLQVALGVPFVVDGRRLGVGASIGATISHGGRDTAAALLREADASMYLAKHRGNVNLATLEMLAGAPAGGRAPAVDDDETFVAATA